MNPEANEIIKLMAVFDTSNSSIREIDPTDRSFAWQPRGDKENAAFNSLTNQDNRQALKAWYASMTSINPLADAFRKILEQAINDDLPLEKK
jgi:hypothetical protein